jgi:micrococcal nuclease
MKTFLILSFFFINIVCFSQVYNGTILRVLDGDTFVLQTDDGSIMVRMNGIDAPEKNQPYGKESGDFLRKFLNKQCKVIKHSIDRYGRTIGDLYIDNTWINLESIRMGLSWHYKKYSKDKILSSAEDSARGIKVGLWKEECPIAPWEWRHKK